MSKIAIVNECLCVNEDFCLNFVAPGPPNDLIDITQGVSVPLIASVVVLALIVILLSIVVVLLIVRKRKADKVTKTDPKNKSSKGTHERNAIQGYMLILF